MNARARLCRRHVLAAPREVDRLGTVVINGQTVDLDETAPKPPVGVGAPDPAPTGPHPQDPR